MPVRKFRGYAAALRTYDKSLFDQERLINFFIGSLIFSDSCSQGIGTHRSSLERGNDGSQNLVVDCIQAPFVDIEFIQRKAGYFQIDVSGSHYLGEIPDTAQQ